MLLDNYSDLPCYITHHAYYDKSCMNYRSLRSLYGFPQSMCCFHRLFCLGSKCDIYDPIPIPIKHEFIQLSLF